MGKYGKIKAAVIVIVLAVLVVGYYFYLSNREKKENEEAEISAVQDVLLKNLDNDYPSTPKELMKYYAEVTKCLHNENYTDEEFEELADRLLAIFDDELVENNPREQYIEDLKEEVSDFKDSGYSISSYTTSSSTDVEEYADEGRTYAKLYCTYSINTGGVNYVSTKQVFILRKETGTGHWKVLAFDDVVE